MWRAIPTLPASRFRTPADAGAITITSYIRQKTRSSELDVDASVDDKLGFTFRMQDEQGSIFRWSIIQCLLAFREKLCPRSASSAIAFNHWHVVSSRNWMGYRRPGRLNRLLGMYRLSLITKLNGVEVDWVVSVVSRGRVWYRIWDVKPRHVQTQDWDKWS